MTLSSERLYKRDINGLEKVAAMRVEIEQEEDGRWVGEVPALPGVLVYAATELEARAKAEALAFRVIADRIEHD